MIIANWKMNGMLADAQRWLGEIGAFVQEHSLEHKVMFCPPATLLHSIKEMCAAHHILLAGQDCHTQMQGAQTGALSAQHIHDGGARFVLLGHSECRQRGDDDDTIRTKLNRAHDMNMQGIVCVGENERTRQKGRAIESVMRQLSNLHEPYGIAYEPLWAIGTGKIPSLADINEMHGAIKEQMGTCPIFYGGSVDEKNAANILSLETVDGVLVGGASLEAKRFMEILKAYCHEA